MKHYIIILLCYSSLMAAAQKKISGKILDEKAQQIPFASVTILRRVLSSSVVDTRTLLGALSVFTLLGLLFGYLFLALGRFKSGAVFTGVAHAEARDYLFFSYTTLTTTGYGNLVPAGDIGQVLAVFEMLVGQIFLVTLVARLVSVWRPRARAANPAGAPDEEQA